MSLNFYFLSKMFYFFVCFKNILCILKKTVLYMKKEAIFAKFKMRHFIMIKQ